MLLAVGKVATRSRLCSALRAAPDLVVVGEVSDEGETTDDTTVANLAREVGADVVVVEARDGGPCSLATAGAIATQGAAAVLVLAGAASGDPLEHAVEVARIGAVGLLRYPAEEESLRDAVRRVAVGEAILSPDTTSRLLRQFAVLSNRPGAHPARAPQADRGCPSVAAEALWGLTRREREVLVCIAGGLSNAALAAELGISDSTVKSHVSRVLVKTGSSSRIQAAVQARRAGLV